MIAKAVQEKDTTLTKKVCRERLEVVFGELVAENKGFVNEEVGRILGLTTGIPHLIITFMPAYGLITCMLAAFTLSVTLSLSQTNLLFLSLSISPSHTLSLSFTLFHTLSRALFHTLLSLFQAWKRRRWTRK